MQAEKEHGNSRVERNQHAGSATADPQANRNQNSWQCQYTCTCNAAPSTEEILLRNSTVPKLNVLISTRYACNSTTQASQSNLLRNVLPCQDCSECQAIERTKRAALSLVCVRDASRCSASHGASWSPAKDSLTKITKLEAQNQRSKFSHPHELLVETYLCEDKGTANSFSP
ncbi:hypothetical protein BV25DRAFT_156255 [Artomyces pyxidatus]|uniref:Uncharacterized protein n=1 Tax=Artomyces pyxidatus TaxID=48021 RepID=A0ACB8T9T3_9AGAM|nr:hypothetical protein BV25DRAFT_156255 [Artomyces pyxidatus]